MKKMCLSCGAFLPQPVKLLVSEKPMLPFNFDNLILDPNVYALNLVGLSYQGARDKSLETGSDTCRPNPCT